MYEAGHRLKCTGLSRVMWCKCMSPLLGKRNVAVAKYDKKKCRVSLAWLDSLSSSKMIKVLILIMVLANLGSLHSLSPFSMKCYADSELYTIH